MAKRRRMHMALPTISNVPDELWELIQPILDELDPPAVTGRPRVDPRASLDAMIYRMRTGCQWNQLPKQFPDDSSVHRTFQRWEQRGVLDRIRAAMARKCEELGGVDWEWQFRCDTRRKHVTISEYSNSPARYFGSGDCGNWLF